MRILAFVWLLVLSSFAWAAAPPPEAPKVFTLLQCEEIGQLLSLEAEMRDSGLSEDDAQEVLDKANTEGRRGAPDWFTSEQIKFLHKLIHHIYEHPEWPADLIGTANTKICKQIYYSNHPDEKPQDSPQTPKSLPPGHPGPHIQTI